MMEENCTFCGACMVAPKDKICTAKGFDFSSSKLYIGNYKNLYIGRTKDKELLKKSTSGGLVTSTLRYCLKNDIIDGVILVAGNKKKPECIIAHNEEELMKRSKSRYHRVPLLKALNLIKDEKKLEIVGLPCHIQAVRKLQEEGYAKEIKLCLGLYCGMNQTYEATKFLLKGKKINKIEYRHNWLGGLRAETDKGLVEISKDFSDVTNYMFMPKRCMVCYDFTNEFADISFGDAWSKKPSEYGWNEIIIRSNLGETVLNGMRDELILEPVDIDTILNSHKGNFAFKKEGIFMRMKKLDLFIDYNVGKKPKESNFQYFYYLFIKIMHWKITKKILGLLPIKLLGGIFSFSKKVVKRVV